MYAYLVHFSFECLADADGKMKIEKIVNNNKNKKNTNLDI